MAVVGVPHGAVPEVKGFVRPRVVHPPRTQWYPFEPYRLVRPRYLSRPLAPSLGFEGLLSLFFEDRD
jgi:hypothetical protein